MIHQKPLLGQQINWAHPLAKGLMGCWVMNESSGSQILDLSGNSYHGEFIAAPKWVVGGGSVGIDFDNINDGIDCGEGPILTEPFTVWALVAADLFMNGDSICVRTQGNPWKHNWYLQTANGGNWKMGYYNGTTWKQVIAGTNYGAGTFVSLVGLWDGKEIKLYENGILLGSTAETLGPHPEANLTLGIGRNVAQSEGTFDGKIYAVAIWNHSLSDNLISDLYIDPYAMFESDNMWMLEAAANAPTATIYGPFVGPMGGPI